MLSCRSMLLWCVALPVLVAGREIDFQKEIRPILSQNCFLCHGPDEADRKGGLRLDLREDALKPAKSGARSIVPGSPEESEIFKRIAHSDADEVMPPARSGKKLSATEIERIRQWIEQGAVYAAHWSYEKPVRPPLPEITKPDWARNPIDYFIADRLEEENLEPSPEADKEALIRRAALDLTGLPPTPAEARMFLEDSGFDAYEKMVDRLLEAPAFGEHWARMWLDLARYADSAGYADDPLRSIWAYRDYVIKSFNDNKPFDQFTIEQIAGDLLPDPAEEQIVATAFHRNTMTNNEGGTNDEEFRAAAVVDRVNTTMAVWMGTSMACAQCHTHKYDPITMEEYFRFYAILNNTEDADKGDESPLHKFFDRAQTHQRAEWSGEIDSLEQILRTSSPELEKAARAWQQDFPRELEWQTLTAEKGSFKQEIATASSDENAISIGQGAARSTYTVEFPLEDSTLTGLRLELASERSGQVETIINRAAATITPPSANVAGRYVRIDLPGTDQILSLAEIEVFSGKENIAGEGEASQSSTDFEGEAKLAIDGNTDGNFNEKSTTHTKKSEQPWWELDLKTTHLLNRIAVWNRTDNNQQGRLSNFRISILDEAREVVWEKEIKEPPRPSVSLAVDGTRSLKLAGAYADSSAPARDPSAVLADKADPKRGWAPGDSARPQFLHLLAEKSFAVEKGSRLVLTLEQTGKPGESLLESFRIAFTAEAALPKYARTPSAILALLAEQKNQSAERADKLLKHYLRQVAPALETERTQVAALQKRLDEMKPHTVPIMRELTGDNRRMTRLQLRGSYLDLGDEVTEGVPAVFHPLPGNAPADRLALAKWLVDEENPLTSRVLANRFWEQIFGVGLVESSEEFGAQGELPSHPELLDWLATEFVEQGWDTKKFLKLLVSSAAYRQTSKVSPELAEHDPDNRLLARGPRFRMPAEAIRDQALFVAGLLSDKIYGPSVKPPRPSSGLNAAFGSSIDWKTSEGEDRLRRGIYTEWRRTSPYPSMTTFDAPNREVCTVRRTRTNTPLQALVTLNDPVYIEAAQGLARRMMAGGSSIAERIRAGFNLCLSREPGERELQRLSELFGQALAEFAKAPDERAVTFAPKDAREPVELAAWTTVANVLLNLDETLMKR